MALTDAQRTVNEGTSLVYTATIIDENSVAVPLSSITAATMTLYDSGTGNIINSREDQNILNANQVTIHATSGLLTWEALPADNAIVGTNKSAGTLEQHIALFKILYGSNKGLNHTLELYVRQLEKVT